MPQRIVELAQPKIPSPDVMLVPTVSDAASCGCCAAPPAPMESCPPVVTDGTYTELFSTARNPSTVQSMGTERQGGTKRQGGRERHACESNPSQTSTSVNGATLVVHTPCNAVVPMTVMFVQLLYVALPGLQSLQSVTVPCGAFNQTSLNATSLGMFRSEEVMNCTHEAALPAPLMLVTEIGQKSEYLEGHLFEMLTSTMLNEKTKKTLLPSWWLCPECVMVRNTLVQDRHRAVLDPAVVPARKVGSKLKQGGRRR